MGYSVGKPKGVGPMQGVRGWATKVAKEFRRLTDQAKLPDMNPGLAVVGAYGPIGTVPEVDVETMVAKLSTAKMTAIKDGESGIKGDKGTILVVDDEAGIHVVLKGFLEPEGYEVMAAHSGREAKEIIGKQGEKIDIVIADVRMETETAGIEVLNEAMRANPEMAVIIMTAYSSEKVVIEALRGRAVQYFEKPLDFDDLVRDVNRFREEQLLKQERRAFELEKAQLEFHRRMLKTIADQLGQVVSIASIETAQTCIIDPDNPRASTIMNDLEQLERFLGIFLRGNEAVEKILRSIKANVGDLRGFLSDFEDSVRNIYRTAHYMRDVVAQARTDSFSPSDVMSVLKKSVVELEQGRRNKINFVEPPEALPQVLLDQQAIQKALGAFLDYAAETAVKKGKDGCVDVGVKKVHDGIEIVIADNGERKEDFGFDLLNQPAYIPGLTFFYERHMELQIAQKIIEAHGGRITGIEGDKETGIKLTIWLPLNLAVE